RQRREVRDEAVPRRVAWQAEPLAPALRRLQAESPVRQLEPRIARDPGRMDLLRGNERRSERESLLTVTPGGIRRHERRGLEHQVAIARERVAVRMLTIRELREIDRMRLLPDQEHADVRGGLAAVRRGHLRPSRALIALTARGLARDGEDAPVPRQRTLEQLDVIPERE